MNCRLFLVLIASVALAPALAAQADPATTDTLRASRASTMKADLKLLAQRQRLFFLRHQTYANSTSRLTLRPSALGLIRILSAGRGGWSATLTASEEPGLACGIFVGDAVAPNAAVVADSEPACWVRLSDGSIIQA